jgi:hypothetical protein
MNHAHDEVAPRGSPPLARGLAPAALVATGVLSGLAIAIRLVSGAPPAHNRFEFGDASMVAFIVLQVAYAAVGALVAARRPAHPVGWLLLLIGLLYAVQNAAGAYVSATIAERGVVETDTAWAGLLADATTFLAGSAFFALILVFPDGRVPIPGWQRLKAWRWRILAVYLPVLAATTLRPGELWLFPQIANPLSVPQLADLKLIPGPGALAGLVVILPLVIVVLFIGRAREGDGVVRQQLKWFALSAVIASFTLAVAAAGGALGQGRTRFGELPLTAFLLSASLMPIAIGMAILRYRLYDIDLIIRRTLIYGGLTVALGGLYGALVLGLQGLLASYTTGDTFAVAASTLAVAALFQPARRAIQAAVDRRFYRSRYDAARTVEAFSAGMRDQVDHERLTEELRRVTQETVRPARVSVWMRDQGGAS